MRLDETIGLRVSYAINPQVDNGNTASFAYTMFNERDKVAANGVVDRYGLDLAERRATTGLDGSTALKLTQYYSDAGPVAYWSAADGNIHFEHGGWLGTERVGTGPTGAVESTFATLPVAFRSSGSLHFQHQDYLGTQRLRTSANGATESTFTSGPFGDAYTGNGPDLEWNHFVGTGWYAESGTQHAQFRQYNSTHGRWLSPDPYQGSYDPTNPNR